MKNNEMKRLIEKKEESTEPLITVEDINGNVICNGKQKTDGNLETNLEWMER